MKRAELVEKNHPKLSVREQCNLLSVSRTALNYKPVEAHHFAMEKSRVKIRRLNHPHSPSDILAPPLQAHAGLCATLRGQPGLAFQSQNIGNPHQSVVAASGTTK